MKNQLRADTVTGVYVAEVENCGVDDQILEDMDFYEALPHVREGEILYGLISDDVAELIAKDYGIR